MDGRPPSPKDKTSLTKAMSADICLFSRPSTDPEIEIPDINKIITNSNDELTFEDYGVTQVMMILNLAHPVLPHIAYLLMFMAVKDKPNVWKVQDGYTHNIDYHIDDLTYRLKANLSAEAYSLLEKKFKGTRLQLTECTDEFMTKMKTKVANEEKPWLEYQAKAANYNKIGIHECKEIFDMKNALYVPQQAAAVLSPHDTSKSILVSTGAYPCFIFAAYNKKEKKGLLSHVDYSSSLDSLVELMKKFGNSDDIEMHIVGGQYNSINQGIKLIERTEQFGQYKTVCLLPSSANNRQLALDVRTGEVTSSSINTLEASELAEKCKLISGYFDPGKTFEQKQQESDEMESRLSHLETAPYYSRRL